MTFDLETYHVRKLTLSEGFTVEALLATVPQKLSHPIVTFLIIILFLLFRP